MPWSLLKHPGLLGAEIWSIPCYSAFIEVTNKKTEKKKTTKKKRVRVCLQGGSKREMCDVFPKVCVQREKLPWLSKLKEANITQDWFPEFFTESSLEGFSFLFACLWLNVFFLSLSLLFPVYDTVQESWTRPHTGHSDVPERRRACEWPNKHTQTHTEVMFFFFYVQENFAAMPVGVHTILNSYSQTNTHTHFFTLSSPTVRLLSLCFSHSVKFNTT